MYPNNEYKQLLQQIRQTPQYKKGLVDFLELFNLPNNTEAIEIFEISLVCFCCRNFGRTELKKVIRIY